MITTYPRNKEIKKWKHSWQHSYFFGFFLELSSFIQLIVDTGQQYPRKFVHTLCPRSQVICFFWPKPWKKSCHTSFSLTVFCITDGKLWKNKWDDITVIVSISMQIVLSQNKITFWHQDLIKKTHWNYFTSSRKQ